MSLLGELHNINKSFGPLKALTDLSFEVGHSEVVGLLGDNGAGKSTTVNMISGIHRPSSGHILSVDGIKHGFHLPLGFRGGGDRDDLPEHRPGRLPLHLPQHLPRARVDRIASAFSISSGDARHRHAGAGKRCAYFGHRLVPTSWSAISRAARNRRSPLPAPSSSRNAYLLLDEPTSALSVRETEALLNQVV
jgi:simple sugar transport system ATP-binding protein